MKNTLLSNTGEKSETLNTEKLSPYLIWLIWVVWIPLFVPVLLELFASHPPLPRLLISLLGVALFFSIYLSANWFNARHLSASPLSSTPDLVGVWLVIITLTALSIPLILLNQSYGWFSLFYYISGYAGGGRIPIKHTVLVLLVLMLFTILVGLLTHSGWNAIWTVQLFIAVISAIIACLGQVVKTNQKLRVAREEIERLAVTAERLRISRDLHDLLGHTLSLITLKSELAGHLISLLPERISQGIQDFGPLATEVGDIEQVARAALQEVREAVSHYRQPVLMSELHAAHEILASAGILYKFEGEKEIIAAIPSAIEAALSWSVREGVTNVIKHSHAHQCLIHLKQEKQILYLEIIDDGKASPGELGNKGNGLRGVAERVAALGGQCEALPCAGGGFRLAVSIPLPVRTPYVPA